MNYFKQTPQIPKVKPIIMLIVDDKEDIAPMFDWYVWFDQPSLNDSSKRVCDQYGDPKQVFPKFSDEFGLNH